MKQMEDQVLHTHFNRKHLVNKFKITWLSKKDFLKYKIIKIDLGISKIKKKCLNTNQLPERIFESPEHYTHKTEGYGPATEALLDL